MAPHVAIEAAVLALAHGADHGHVCLVSHVRLVTLRWCVPEADDGLVIVYLRAQPGLQQHIAQADQRARPPAALRDGRLGAGPAVGLAFGLAALGGVGVGLPRLQLLHPLQQARRFTLRDAIEVRRLRCNVGVLPLPPGLLFRERLFGGSLMFFHLTFGHIEGFHFLPLTLDFGRRFLLLGATLLGILVLPELGPRPYPLLLPFGCRLLLGLFLLLDHLFHGLKDQASRFLHALLVGHLPQLLWASLPHLLRLLLFGSLDFCACQPRPNPPPAIR
mmetsp:Transcript_5198/g.9010  ORF Transcript_5198/g.9010 Transcript_5198/m.9010 type:complete len:275 (-) Transcript_5198:805-1629(-)